MNYIEALKSGKPYRRLNWCSWREAIVNPIYLAGFTETYGDIISEDWEVLEKPVTITAKQLFEAYAAEVKRGEMTRGIGTFLYPDIAAVARRLGL